MTHASNMRKRTCVKTVASNKTRTLQPIFSNRSLGGLSLAVSGLMQHRPEAALDFWASIVLSFMYLFGI